VRNGKATALGGEYPSEVLPLVVEVNDLLMSRRRRSPLPAHAHPISPTV